MSSRSSTIPLLPDSIAVGLQDDLLQYLIELKFLLLFFEKPLCLMGNGSFQYLSQEAVRDIKLAKKPHTTVFVDDPGSELKNVDVIRTDEWDEVFAQCRQADINIQMHSTWDDVHTTRADHLFDSSGLTYQQFAAQAGALLEQDDLPADITKKVLGDYLLRINMRVMFDVLEMCCAERIPMIWGDVAEVGMAKLYTRYLLDQFATNALDTEVPTVLRTLHGETFLGRFLISR